MSIDLKRFKNDIGDEKTGSDWADWLDDDKPPAEVQQELRTKRVERANRYVRRPVIAPPPSSASETTPKASASGLSIQINVPEWHKPEFKRAKAAWKALKPHLTRKRIIATATIVVVVGALWGGLAIIKQHNDRKAQQLAAGNYPSQTLAAQAKPTFTPAVPSSKQDLVTPDGTHSRFDASKGTYSYVDKIGDVQVTVSEQKTGSAADATADATKAAKNLGTNVQFASKQLKSGWGTVYLLTSQKYGNQVAVVGVRELLVLISSTTTISDSQWTTYINSLQ